MNLKKLYSNRFSSTDIIKRNQIWKILCQDFFQNYVDPANSVLDIGAGYCEFINNISCRYKIALDLNPNTINYAEKNVSVITESCFEMSSIHDESIDVVFMSNFLEHLKNKDEVLAVLSEAYRVLKQHGKVLILQPNIRFLSDKYWDFLDHHTPLSDRSLIEALEIVNFSINVCYPKFLPYTTKSKLPKNIFLLRVYLKFSILWHLFGKQCFICAIK